MADHKIQTTKLVSALTRITMEFSQNGKVRRESAVEFDTIVGDFEAHIAELKRDLEAAHGLYERANAFAKIAGVYDMLEAEPVRGEERRPVTGKGNVTIQIGAGDSPGPKFASPDAPQEPAVQE